MRLLGLLTAQLGLCFAMCSATASAQQAITTSYGGEVRAQYEVFANEEWGAEPPDGNGYALQRYMLHGDLRRGTRWRLFGELKSGIETGRAGGPRPPDEDRLDLHQGFLDVTFRPAGIVVTVRAGRQEFGYGSQRLISVREGPNVRQSFDGVRGTVERGRWRIDAFASRPVTTARGIFDDRNDPRRVLWGAYAVRASDAPRRSGMDIYYLGYRRASATFEQGTATEVRHSAGTRLWATGGRVDHNLEMIAQFGAFGTSRIRAWTVASDTGVRLGGMGQPRIGARADITSGDGNRTDDTLGTFNAMFPRGAYFGLVSPAGPANHIDIHPQLRFTPQTGCTVTGSWLFYWRQRTTDGIYGLTGQLLRLSGDAHSRFVGHSPGVELEVQAGYGLTVTANLAAFTAGPFVREGFPAQMTRFFAIWTTYRF